MTSLRQKQIQAHIDEEHRIKHVIIKRLKKNIGSHTTPERQPDAKINNNVEKTSSKLVDILHEALNQYKKDLMTFLAIQAIANIFKPQNAGTPAKDKIEPKTIIAQIRNQTRNSNFLSTNLDIYKKFNDIIREYISPSISSVDRSDIKTKLVRLQPLVKENAIGLENLYYGLVRCLDTTNAPQEIKHLSDTAEYVINSLSLLVNINDMIFYDRYQLITDKSLEQVKQEYITQLPARYQGYLVKYAPTQNAKLIYQARNLPRLK